MTHRGGSIWYHLALGMKRMTFIVALHECVLIYSLAAQSTNTVDGCVDSVVGCVPGLAVL
jgi:hypothetical protein